MVKFFVQVPAPPENNQRKSDSDSIDMWWRPPTIANKDHEDVLRAMNLRFMDFILGRKLDFLPQWPDLQHVFCLGKCSKKMLRLSGFAQKMSTCKKPIPEASFLEPPPPILVESQRPIRWARTFWTFRALTSGRCFFHGIFVQTLTTKKQMSGIKDQQRL